jgi:hypothetical protein
MQCHSSRVYTRELIQIFTYTHVLCSNITVLLTLLYCVTVAIGNYPTTLHVHVLDGYGFSENQTFTVVDSVDGHKVRHFTTQSLSHSVTQSLSHSVTHSLTRVLIVISVWE